MRRFGAVVSVGKFNPVFVLWPGGLVTLPEQSNNIVCFFVKENSYRAISQNLGCRLYLYERSLYHRADPALLYRRRGEF